MKKFFDWIGYLFWGFLILAVVSVLFLVNSTQTVQWAAQKYAPQYGLGYKSISGGLLSGLEVEELSYKDDKLFDKLRIGWNPATILAQRVSVTHLDIEGVDVENVIHAAQSFAPPKPAEESPEGRSQLPVSIGLSKLHITTKPFTQKGISVNAIELDGKGAVYSHDKLQIANFTLNADTNVSKLSVNGKIDERRITLSKVALSDVDTIVLSHILASQEHNEKNMSKPSVPKPESQSPDEEEELIIPMQLLVEQMNASVKSAHYDPVIIQSAELNATDLDIDMAAALVKSGKVDLEVKSNFAETIHHATVVKNTIQSKGEIIPLKALFDTYKIPLRQEGLENIQVTINADKDNVKADVVLKGSGLLETKKGEFNVDKLHIDNKITYRIGDSNLTVNSNAKIATPYAKDIRVINYLHLKEKMMEYNGTVTAGKIEGMDQNISKPIENLTIAYRGSDKGINAFIDARDINGSLITNDFKKGDLALSTKRELDLKDIVSLPKELQEGRVTGDLYFPIDFAKPIPLAGKAKIRSNLANIDADIRYDKQIQINSKTIFPPNSLLRSMIKEVKFDAISPLDTKVIVGKKSTDIFLESKGLVSTIRLDTTSSSLKGGIVLGGAKFDFEGDPKQKIFIKNSITSLQSLLKQIQTVYQFDQPPFDGDAKVAIEITELKKIKLTLNSNRLVDKSDPAAEKIFSDTMVSLGFENSVISLDGYRTTFDGQKIFATKPSQITLKESIVEISPLWINDELKLTGQYNIKVKKGQLLSYADPLTLSHKMVDLGAVVDLKTDLDGDKTSIRGSVSIDGGNIHYDMDTKKFSTDSDIVIIQELQNKKQSPFMEHLATSITVKTKKPLLYKTSQINIQLKPDLQILKESFGPILVLGTVELPEGGTYRFEKKNFRLKKSMISFTGDPAKPLLDITATHKTLNYDIKIQITGSASMPNIQFSSKPYLSREQILSVILFDSEDAAGSNSSEDMMKMMGGAMAKSALSDMGVQLDHLAFGTDGSVEVGKKISDKLTIIYVNDEVSSVKVRYDYSRRIEGDIVVSPESSGADIFYKREF